jgi:hypothetical protein
VAVVSGPLSKRFLAMTHEESGVDTARGWQKVVNEAASSGV